jgi:hypothetical protein
MPDNKRGSDEEVPQVLRDIFSGRAKETPPAPPPAETSSAEIEQVREPPKRLEETPGGKKAKWKDLPPPPQKSRRERVVEALKLEAGGAWQSIRGGVEKDVDIARRRVRGQSLEPYEEDEPGALGKAEKQLIYGRKGRRSSKGRMRAAKKGKRRAPVPGGRPKRPWIPSRKAMAMVEPAEPDIFGYGDVEAAMNIGMEFGLPGGGDPFGGGMDMGDIMNPNLLDDMMGFGTPRRRGKKRR